MPPIQDRNLPPVPNKSTPHLWTTRDTDGGECTHLAVNEDGAIQAHLLHFGMLNFSGVISVVDLGHITARTDRSGICFDPLCVLYGLSIS